MNLGLKKEKKNNKEDLNITEIERINYFLAIFHK